LGEEEGYSAPEVPVMRKIAMAPTILNVIGTKATVRWIDGVTWSLRWGAPVPLDWVEGTNIVLGVLCVQVDTDGSPTAVFKSSIQVASAGETMDMNIEDLAPCNLVLPKSAHVALSRTIPGVEVEPGAFIDWALYRYGGDAVDTVNSTVYCIFGAWMEYTATGDE